MSNKDTRAIGIAKAAQVAYDNTFTGISTGQLASARDAINGLSSAGLADGWNDEAAQAILHAFDYARDQAYAIVAALEVSEPLTVEQWRAKMAERAWPQKRPNESNGSGQPFE